MKQLVPDYSIRACCAALKLTPRGFKAWCLRPDSPDLNQLKTDLLTCFGAHRGRAGAPKLKHDLAAKGHQLSVRSVGRLMASLSLKAKGKRKFRHTTDSNHTLHISDNLLDRDFKAQRPNEKWVGDITYIQTSDGWLYLATVIDLYSRRIVGWQMSSRITAKLVTDALKAAYQTRGRPVGVLFHSDRGSQYCSDMFRQFLKDNNIIQSMSRKGNCWDNAVAESFFKSLKTEAIDGEPLISRANMRAEVFEYIEAYYNSKRRHSSIGYCSPKGLEMRRDALLLKWNQRTQNSSFAQSRAA
jgi:putative transposase